MTESSHVSDVAVDDLKVSDLDVSDFYLDPESEDGNCEYKYQLIGLSDIELENKTTQMNFRLDEGSGEATYELGIMDDGCPLGLTRERLDLTLKTINDMAEQLNADVQVIDTSLSPVSLSQSNRKVLYAKCLGVNVKDLTKEDLQADRYVCEVMIRRQNQDHNYVSLRLVVAGNVDSGKTTTIGCLTQGLKDNGDGLARSNIFVHQHELETGRTSSISQEILGFDSKGDIVNERLHKLKAPTWPEIVRESSKICILTDLAGHQKYFGVTMRGISSTAPDYALIMIGANMGISSMTREHMIIMLLKRIPMIIVFTKIDLAPAHILAENIDKIEKLLKGTGVNKTPYRIKDRKDVVNCCHNIASGAIVPILTLSNVTGENSDLLKLLMNCLPPRVNYHEQLNKPSKFSIQEIFSVTGIGTVVSGFLMTGVVSIKNVMWLGPDNMGKFKKVVVKSIHDKRTDVTNALAGQSVCFALRNVDRSMVEKGMVLLDGRESEPQGIFEFEAVIEILGKNSTSIRLGYEPVIHISNIKQTAKIIKISDVIRRTVVNPKKKDKTAIPENDDKGNPVLRSGDKARCRFRFRFDPVYIETGNQVVFREGLTRGVGHVENVYTCDQTPDPHQVLLKNSKVKMSASARRKLYRDQVLNSKPPEISVSAAAASTSVAVTPASAPV